MGLRNLREFHNACEESAGKRYIDYGEAGDYCLEPGTLLVHPSGTAVLGEDPDAYKVPVGGTIAQKVLYDYFGTSPDTELAERCQAEFVEPKVGRRGGLVTFTAEQLHDWLDEDCVNFQAPDVWSSGPCTLYEQEGIVRKLIRRWRGL
jgi:hypothetical protein